MIQKSFLLHILIFFLPPIIISEWIDAILVSWIVREGIFQIVFYTLESLWCQFLFLISFTVNQNIRQLDRFLLSVFLFQHSNGHYCESYWTRGRTWAFSIDGDRRKEKCVSQVPDNVVVLMSTYKNAKTRNFRRQILTLQAYRYPMNWLKNSSAQ